LKIPSFVLRKLYVSNSLGNEDGGFCFRLRNSLGTAELTVFPEIEVDGDRIPKARVSLWIDGKEVKVKEISVEKPLCFPKNTEAKVFVAGRNLGRGLHTVVISTETKEFKTLRFDIEEVVG